MGETTEPFIGSEALASGGLRRYDLHTNYRTIMPNINLHRGIEPTLRQRTAEAWLWSRREAVVAGLAASAIHGAKWVDDDVPVELIWRNARSPKGVVTRDDLLFEEEIGRLDRLPVTTVERTAFDLGRRDGLGLAGQRASMRWRAQQASDPRRLRRWPQSTATRAGCVSSKRRWT